MYFSFFFFFSSWLIFSLGEKKPNIHTSPSSCFYGNASLRRAGSKIMLPLLLWWKATGRNGRKTRGRLCLEEKGGKKDNVGKVVIQRRRGGKVSRQSPHFLVQNGVSMVTSTGCQKIETPSVFVFHSTSPCWQAYLYLSYNLIWHCLDVFEIVLQYTT